MPGAIILNEDWSEYEKRKSAENADISRFNCREPWEVEFLSAMVFKRFESLVSKSSINKAISLCCKETDIPMPRKEFVNCVILKLIS